MLKMPRFFQREEARRFVPSAEPIGNTSSLDVSVPTDSVGALQEVTKTKGPTLRVTPAPKAVNAYVRSFTLAEQKLAELKSNYPSLEFKIHAFDRNDFLHSLSLRPYFMVCWDAIPEGICNWHIRSHIKNGGGLYES